MLLFFRLFLFCFFSTFLIVLEAVGDSVYCGGRKLGLVFLVSRYLLHAFGACFCIHVKGSDEM